jgi:hypothetical protein
LGSEPEIQVATNVSNHLMSGIMKYFGDSGRYGPAVNLFEKLLIRDGEIASLLASAYIGMGGCASEVSVKRKMVLNAFVFQRRRSKQFKYCIVRYKIIHNLIPFCTFRQTIYGTR